MQKKKVNNKPVIYKAIYGLSKFNTGVFADRIDRNLNELKKGTPHIVAGFIEYVPGTIISKTIIKKNTGNITAMSFAVGEALEEKVSPFDIYVQIIEGAAELITNDEIYNLIAGSGFIIPANTTHHLHAKEKFKVICTVIKNGYECII